MSLFLAEPKENMSNPTERAVKNACVVRVYGSGLSVRGSPCSRPAKVQENGKWYCAIHCSDAKKKRDDKFRARLETSAAKSTAKWAAEKEKALNAERYKWLREHPAWETESFLGGLSPEAFDAEIDARRKEAS